MTTITNNKLTDERVSNAMLIRLIQWADQHNSHYVAAALCELQERRKADSVRPVGYVSESAIFCLGLGQHEVITAKPEKDADDARYWDVIPLYAAPPVQETSVYNDVLNIIGLLEKNEWAEHCTSTVLGSLLESEITRLVDKEQPASVVPEEMPKGLAGQIVSLLAHNIGDKFLAQKIWNACRAAMLQAGNHTEQHLDMVDHSGDANEKGSDGTFIDEGTKQAGNSPVIPEGSFSGLVNSARALLDVLYEFGADEVAISEYVTNLEDALRVAVAPQQ